MKGALAIDRPIRINLDHDKIDLKARWHAIAKEVAYKLLDLRKGGWKECSHFEK